MSFTSKTIDGVEITPLILHHDNRGFLTEVLRDSDRIYEKFGQLTFALAYPDVIKAFHWHEHQTDHWFFVTGNAEVVLFDRREDSASVGVKQVICAGENNRVLITIPSGVWHGYRVLGNTPAMLCYVTTEVYDHRAPDEHREPHDAIEHDWTTKPR